MRDSKKYLTILKRLNEDGFLHEEDFESQLKNLIEELDDNDREYVKALKEELEKINSKKESQINYFTMILSREPNVLDTIYKNFLIG